MIFDKETGLKFLSTAEKRMVRYFRCRPDRAAEMLLGIDLLPFQRLMLIVAWYFPFTLLILTRGAGKTFQLAVLATLRAALYSSQKVGVIAASYRQSKMVFAEIERMYRASKVFRDMCVKPPVRSTDMCELGFKNGSMIQALPLGDGEKIRGARFYFLLLDEIAQIPLEILDVVILGMTATKKDPIKSARREAVKQRLREEGRDSEIDAIFGSTEELTRNYVIAASTAFYQFNHLYDMLKKYVKIITEKKLVEKNMELWKSYAVYKLAYNMLPEGFMSIESVLMAKEKMSSMQFKMEYETLFPSDSGGFFPASIVMNCWDKALKIHYEVSGVENGSYVLFVDPARTSDNCSFVVLKKVNTNTNTKYAPVNVSVVNGRKFQEAADRIRMLHRRFNFMHIGMDSGGGGHAIADILCDPDKVPVGEHPIWNIEDDDSYLDDKKEFKKPGLHLLQLVPFHAAWLSIANHGLLSSMETKEVVFPTPLDVNDLVGKTADEVAELEEIEIQVNELKTEITTIVMTKTSTGNPHWDTPRARQRKDRYSAFMGGLQIFKSYMQGCENAANGDFEIGLASGGWTSAIGGESANVAALSRPMPAKELEGAARLNNWFSQRGISGTAALR
jgi:hypothetical protein